jgi:hypothetical protein
MTFEANQGQRDPPVQFVSGGNHYLWLLTGGGEVLGTSSVQGSSTTGVDMQVVGANPASQPIGLDPLPGKTNYFLSNDPSRWRRDVANFTRVEYPDIYPGIDLAYYGNQQQLEYDFIVNPGADASTIHLDFGGARSVTVDSTGDLLVTTAAGTVQQNKPVVYEDVNGNRQPIEGAFALTGPGQVGFQVGSYNHTLPLVIDPVLTYSTYLGGSGDDDGLAITLDSMGDIFVAGQTSSADFPVSSGAFQTGSGGGQDAFVTELDPSGTTILYSTFLGGTGNDRASAITVDGQGFAYVTGRTASMDFPVTPGVFGPYYGGGDYDAYVTKLTPAGDRLVYSTYLGGEGNDSGFAIAVDAAGDAYVAGGTGSDDFPTTQSAYQYAPYGTDAFITEFNPTASDLLYSSRLGGSFSNERANAIALAPDGGVYLTGQTPSPDFPTWNAFEDTFGGGFLDAFVAKFDVTQSGDNSLIFSTYLGGSGDDRGLGIAVAPDGSVWVSGETTSPDFPVLAAWQPNYTGTGYNGFLAHFTSSGTLLSSTYLGGSGSDGATGVAVDSNGNVYLTGFTSSPDFPTMNPFQDTLAGGSNAFVAEFSPDGSTLLFSSYLGGSGNDNPSETDIHNGAITVDGAGNIYLFGKTTSPDFPTVNPYQGSLMGIGNTFLAIVSPFTN